MTIGPTCRIKTFISYGLLALLFTALLILWSIQPQLRRSDYVTGIDLHENINNLAKQATPCNQVELTYTLKPLDNSVCKASLGTRLSNPLPWRPSKCPDESWWLIPWIKLRAEEAKDISHRINKIVANLWTTCRKTTLEAEFRHCLTEHSTDSDKLQVAYLLSRLKRLLTWRIVDVGANKGYTVTSILDTLMSARTQANMDSEPDTSKGLLETLSSPYVGDFSSNWRARKLNHRIAGQRPVSDKLKTTFSKLANKRSAYSSEWLGAELFIHYNMLPANKSGILPNGLCGGCCECVDKESEAPNNHQVTPPFNELCISPQHVARWGGVTSDPKGVFYPKQQHAHDRVSEMDSFNLVMEFLALTHETYQGPLPTIQLICTQSALHFRPSSFTVHLYEPSVANYRWLSAFFASKPLVNESSSFHYHDTQVGLNVHGYHMAVGNNNEQEFDEEVFKAAGQSMPVTSHGATHSNLDKKKKVALPHEMFQKYPTLMSLFASERNQSDLTNTRLPKKRRFYASFPDVPLGSETGFVKKRTIGGESETETVTVEITSLDDHLLGTVMGGDVEKERELRRSHEAAAQTANRASWKESVDVTSLSHPYDSPLTPPAIPYIDYLASDAQGHDVEVFSGSELLFTASKVTDGKPTLTSVGGHVSMYQMEMGKRFNYRQIFVDKLEVAGTEDYGYVCYFPTESKAGIGTWNAAPQNVPKVIRINSGCWRTEFGGYSGWINAVCHKHDVQLTVDGNISQPHLNRSSITSLAPVFSLLETETHNSLAGNCPSNAIQKKLITSKIGQFNL